MRCLVAAAVISAFLVTPSYAELILNSYAFSKQYKVTITDEAIEKSPAWKDDAENPPLSAKKAIKLADAMKDSLVKDSKDRKWKLTSASLEPLGDGKWYWLVSYEAEFQGGMSTGIAPNLRLVILMDGMAIKPAIKDER
jgi:hypothetical protein